MTEHRPLPQLGDRMAPAHPSQEAIDLLWNRRSTTANMLCDPGPDAQTLNEILTISSRAPDHRRVTPYRFIVFQGDRRAQIGDVFAAAFKAAEPNEPEERVALERNRFMRAPVVVAVVSALRPDHKTPVWEQTLTAGAVCQNMLIAASAFGFAAQWLTEWYAYDDAVLNALDLGADERIAGYVYIGSATEDPKERPRPNVADLVRYYQGCWLA